MKIKIFALLLVACVSLLALASCGGEGGGETTNDGGGNDITNDECKHTFSEAWSSNDTQHWHQATCEHGEVKDSLANHIDTNEDGKCDLCAYEVGHDHIFSTEWTYDEDYHWKNAICSHGDQKDQLDLHSDDNNNGECDVCPSHVHAMGNSGFCKYDGCGKPMAEIDTSDIDTLITAVTNQGGLVNKVEIEYIININSNNKDYQENGSWLSYNTSTKHNISVLFGKGGYVNNFTNSHVITGLGSHQSTSTSTFESWHEKDGSTAFGVYSEDGGEVALDVANADKLLGNYYTLSTVADGYGTENFLYSIYEAAKSSNARDLVITTDGNKVTISFNLLVVDKITGTEIGDITEDGIQTGATSTNYNVNYFEVSASFTYNDNYVITSLDAFCNCYTNNAGQLSNKEPNLKDVNLRYYPETGKFEFVKYDTATESYIVVDKSEITPNNYSYSVTQTVGERTADNPRSKNSFIPTNFDLYSDPECTVKLGDSLTGTVKEFLYIYLGNYQPEGTSIEHVYDLIGFEILDSKGKVIEGTDIMEGNSQVFKMAFTFDENQNRYFMLYPLKAGNYTFVINYRGATAYTIPITVK